MRPRAIVVAAILLTVPREVCAFFNAEARRVSDFEQVCKTVVIAPLNCPAKVNCLWLEKKLAAEIREEGLRVVPAAQVRQKMFDLGLEASSPEVHEKILEAFRADAAVIANIGGVQSNAEGTSAGFWSGSSVFFTIQDEHHTGQASLVFISKDGRKLLEGQGNGESHNPDRTEKGLLAKVLRLIVEKAFRR